MILLLVIVRCQHYHAIMFSMVIWPWVTTLYPWCTIITHCFAYDCLVLSPINLMLSWHIPYSIIVGDYPLLLAINQQVNY